MNQPGEAASAFSINRAVQFDFRFDAVALCPQINRRRAFNITGNNALNGNPPAKEAAALPARRCTIGKRSEALWHFTIELVRERAGAEAQDRRYLGLYYEPRILIGTERRFLSC